MMDWKKQAVIVLATCGLTLRLSNFQFGKAVLGMTFFALSLHILHLFENNRSLHSPSDKKKVRKQAESQPSLQDKKTNSPTSTSPSVDPIQTQQEHPPQQNQPELQTPTPQTNEQQSNLPGAGLYNQFVKLGRSLSGKKIEIEYEGSSEIEMRHSEETKLENQKPYLFVCVKCDISRNARFIDDIEDIKLELQDMEQSSESKKESRQDQIDQESTIVVGKKKKKEKKEKIEKKEGSTTDVTTVVEGQVESSGVVKKKEKKEKDKLKTGKVLYEKVKVALEEKQLLGKVNLVASKCLSMCDYSNCIAVADPKKYTYQFGHLDHRDSTSDIVQFVEMYLSIENGYTKTKGRPAKLGSTILARIPPLDVEQSTLGNGPDGN